MGYSMTTKELPPSDPQMRALKNLIEGRDAFPDKNNIPKSAYGPITHTMKVLIRNKWVDDENKITDKGRKAYQNRLNNQQTYKEQDHER